MQDDAGISFIFLSDEKLKTCNRADSRTMVLGPSMGTLVGDEYHMLALQQS